MANWTDRPLFQRQIAKILSNPEDIPVLRPLIDALHQKWGGAESERRVAEGGFSEAQKEMGRRLDIEKSKFATSNILQKAGDIGREGSLSRLRGGIEFEKSNLPGERAMGLAAVGLQGIGGISDIVKAGKRAETLNTLLAESRKTQKIYQDYIASLTGGYNYSPYAVGLM